MHYIHVTIAKEQIELVKDTEITVSIHHDLIEICL